MVPAKKPRPDGYVHHGARGLCHKDYQRRRYDGTIADIPTALQPWRDFADDYAILRREGYPLDIIAERLGMSVTALDKSLTRHRDDDRARRPNLNRTEVA